MSSIAPPQPQSARYEACGGGDSYKLKQTIIGVLLIALMPISAKAVDGYKEFKFGMSVDAVRKLAKTRLIRVKTPDGSLGYRGQGFPFAGNKVDISFIFTDTVNPKLLRVAFPIPIDTALATCRSLSDKYGEPSSHSEGDIEKPNNSLFMAYDNDTIVVKIASDETNRQSAVVIYTSPEYDSRLLQLQQSKLKDDL
jgi:hypothetical protein